MGFRRFNPKQPRDKLGRWSKVSGASSIKRNAAVVPYVRTSLRSQTVGVNAGSNVSRGLRVSVGAYARIERRNAGALEQQIKKADTSAIQKITRTVSPNRKADPFIEAGLRSARRKIVNKTIGGQKKLGDKAYARLTTSQSGLPSVSIRKGQQRVSASKRRAGIDRYNAAMATSLRRNRPKVSRPQRRNVAGRRIAA